VHLSIEAPELGSPLVAPELQMGGTIALLILQAATLCQRYFKRVTSQRLTPPILASPLCFPVPFPLHDSEMKQSMNAVTPFSPFDENLRK
jgi:hypothetical protein